MKIPLVAALVALAISFASPAFSQQKSLKELIVGTWLLDSVYDQTQDGVKHNPWGDGVKGQAIYTRRWTFFLDDNVSQPSKSGHQSAHPSWTSNRLLGHLHGQ